MSINFREFGESNEVEQKLKAFLQVGVSTIPEVQTFLGVNQLMCSEVTEFNERYIRYVSQPENLITEGFDSCIRCHIKNVASPKDRPKHDGRWPWQWLWNWILAQTIRWDYFVHFSFRDQTLVQIAVWKVGTGL